MEVVVVEVEVWLVEKDVDVVVELVVELVVVTVVLL